MQPLLTIVNNSRPLFCGVFALVCLAVFTAAADECATGKGLSSNYIMWLTGNGDTLWMITWDGRSNSFNSIAGEEAINHPEEEQHWWSYALSCKKEGVYDCALGNGYAVASIDSTENVLWRYRFSNGAIDEFPVHWPDKDNANFTINDIVFTDNAFFCAAIDGGLMRWNDADDEKTIFFPGEEGVRTLSSLRPETIPDPDSMKAVTAIEVVHQDSLLLVFTPEQLWYFSIADSGWDDTSMTRTCTDDDCTLKTFDYVFINMLDSARPIYAIATVRKDGADQDTSFLCKYNRHTSTWDIFLKRAPKALTFGFKGCMYMLFDDNRTGSPLRNIAMVYQDIPGDTGCVENAVPVETEEYFNHRMTDSYNIDYPDELTDILFIPKTDTSGYLWISTSEGLFFSRDEVPGSDASSFLLIKRAPPVKYGLKNTYARPGIITPSNKECVFVYNIKKDRAKVTIRVYDYNMDCVKTIIYKKPRLSGSNGGPLGRSTVESEDRWDGKNESGRRCAPGIYYYKITTDSGERDFGKIVVAR